MFGVAVTDTERLRRELSCSEAEGHHPFSACVLPAPVSAPDPTRLADLNVAVTQQTDFLLSRPPSSISDAASFLHVRNTPATQKHIAPQMPSACDTFKGLADTPTLFSVDGLVAVVTGGGTGIGLMIAQALEHNGATVYIVSRRLSVLEEAAREHNRRGNIIPLQGDVTSRESMQAVAETIRQRHGYVNLLVNNAGMAKSFLPKLPGPGEVDMKKYQELLWNAGSPNEFSGAFDANVTSAWYCAVAFLDLLDAANKRGNMPGVTSQIITVSSGGAFRKDDKVFSVPYTLSKSAATHLGKMLAHFLKDWNIRSNIIAPGIFPSEMIEGLISQEYINAGVPLRRAGTIDDMGGLILFLASRAGAYMNGTVQLVDGGRLLLFPSTY